MIPRQAQFTLAAALLALAGCQAPPPPPPPPPAPAMLPTPPAFVPPSPKVVSARWSFAINESSCVAHASNRNVSLTLSISTTKMVELSVAGQAMGSISARGVRRARFQFEGPGGSWTLPARSTPDRAVLAAVPLSETMASHLLALLGGGHLRTEVGTANVLEMRLPNSDVAGREWFDCARGKLGHAALGP